MEDPNDFDRSEAEIDEDIQKRSDVAETLATNGMSGVLTLDRLRDGEEINTADCPDQPQSNQT